MATSTIPNTAIPPVAETELPGFSAFFDSLLSQSGGTVMKPGGKAGNLHTTGPFRGMTSEQGRQQAMRLWQSMPPAGRAQYAPKTAPAPAPAATPAPAAAPAVAAPATATPPPAIGQATPAPALAPAPNLAPSGAGAAPAPAPAPAAPRVLAPPPIDANLAAQGMNDAARGVYQRGSGGSVEYKDGASITPTGSAGARSLTTPSGGTGSVTYTPAGRARPPAIFTNMETGQQQSLAQATAGRAVLPAPAGRAPSAARPVSGIASASGVPATPTPTPTPIPSPSATATATAPPAAVPALATVGKPAGAMAITPTPPQISANPPVASAVQQPPRSGPAPIGALTPPSGPPPAARMMTPLQQGSEVVQNTGMGVKAGAENAISSAVGTATNAVKNTVQAAKKAVLWPFTPRPVK